MNIKISDKEQTRIKSATAYYKEQGHDVEVTNLQIGDYIFDNKVAFEFKTIADFVASIQDNRVFNEAINQAENFDYHFVDTGGEIGTAYIILDMTTVGLGVPDEPYTYRIKQNVPASYAIMEMHFSQSC